MGADRPVRYPSSGADRPITPGGEPLDREEIAALRAIVEGTVQSIGAAFFESLVTHLASAIGVGYAFVAEFDGAAMRRAPSPSGPRGRSGTTSNSTWPGLPART